MINWKLTYWNDILLLIAFLIVAVSGIVIFFFLPSGIKGGSFYTVWGISKHTWKEWHNYSGLAMMLLTGTHLALHWRWLVGMTKKMFKN